MNLSTFYDQAPPSDTPVATPKASPWLPQALPLKASPLTTIVPPPTTFRSGPRFLAQLCSLRSENGIWDLRVLNPFPDMWSAKWGVRSEISQTLSRSEIWNSFPYEGTLTVNNKLLNQCAVCQDEFKKGSLQILALNYLKLIIYFLVHILSSSASSHYIHIVIIS